MRSLRVMRSKVVECTSGGRRAREVRQTRVASGAASWQSVSMVLLRTHVLVMAAATAVSACGTSPAGAPPVSSDGGMPLGDSNPTDGLNEVQFPASFLFGTAIAGFQADMGCPKLPPPQCDDRNSDWYDFTTAKATVSDPNAYLSGQDPSKVGPGFWELYAEDIQRAGDDLHNGALRLSIEWSRIFPKMTDGAD